MSRPGGGSGRSWFPWKTACLLLLLLIYYLVDKDIKTHKSFEASKTGIFLKDVGLDQHALDSYAYVTERVVGLKEWGERTAPAVAARAAQLRKQATPYAQAAADAARRGYRRCADAAWWAAAKVEEQLPGAGQKLHFAYEETVRFALWLWDRAVHYALLFSRAVADVVGAAWVQTGKTFNRIASSSNKMDATMDEARGAFAWTSAKAADATQWVRETVASFSAPAKANKVQ